MPRDRARTIRRLRIVQEVNTMIDEGKGMGLRAGDIVATYSEVLRGRGFRVSPTTIQRYRRVYRLGRLAALIDRRSHPDCKVDLSPFAAFLNFIKLGWNHAIASKYKSFTPRFETAYYFALREVKDTGDCVCEYWLAAQSLRRELAPTLPQKARRNAENVLIERP